jgi:hypothetical protein
MITLAAIGTSLLGLGKRILLSKEFICVVVGVALFIGGYLYRGTVEGRREAKVVIREVVRYVEVTNDIRDRYDNLPTDSKEMRESILSGQVSSHARGTYEEGAE